MLVVTSDLPEALRIADRLLVVRGGTTTASSAVGRVRPTCSQRPRARSRTGSPVRVVPRPTERRPVHERRHPGTRPLPEGGAPPSREARSGIIAPPVSGQELVLIGVIAVLWVLLGIFTPAFLTAGSIQPLLVGVAPIALIGVGMTFVIITGGIDVSVGSALMVCAVV